MIKIKLLTFLTLLGVVGSFAEAQQFYPDDPLLEDEDRLDTPEQPASIELSDIYDRLGHIFRDVGSSPIGSEAENVNTLDEVPNSSWFTNRHGVRRMSIEELKRGPNRGGPSSDDKWRVFKSKSQGLTPGFEIRDSKGHRYVIKLDPIGVPELSSAAEVIATNLFYAIGYNVPENYIVRYHPDNFEIEPGTEMEDSYGDKVALAPWRFRRMIRRVPRLEDGRMRVTASKYISGLPLGPFRYYGTRTDDPNDIFPHEDRRELRGLRLFAAWMNHDDTRAHNTQDTWLEENGTRYIKHYLMDFGSTFGSGSVDMQYPNLSFTYWLDLGEVKKNAGSFGFRVPKYRKVKWPEYPEHESVGRWEGEAFDAMEWRNDYPNPAFVRMTARDAFWAAKIIMRFTPEELQTIVENAQYSDAKIAKYFLDVLIQRQLKCGRTGINAVNPLDDFRVVNEALEFTNLSEKYGFSESGTNYRIGWHVFNNDDGSVESLRAPLTQSETRLALPRSEYGGSQTNLFLLAEIESLHDDFPHWAEPVRVTLRPGTEGYDVVGIQRQ